MFIPSSSTALCWLAVACCLLSVYQHAAVAVLTSPQSGPGSPIANYTYSEDAYISFIALFSDGYWASQQVAINRTSTDYTLYGAVEFLAPDGLSSTIDAPGLSSSITVPGNRSADYPDFATYYSQRDLTVEPTHQYLVFADGGGLHTANCSLLHPIPCTVIEEEPARVSVTTRSLTLVAEFTTYFDPLGVSHPIPQAQYANDMSAMLYYVGGQGRLVINPPEVGVVSISDFSSGAFIASINYTGLVPGETLDAYIVRYCAATQEIGLAMSYNGYSYVGFWKDSSGAGDYQLTRLLNVSAVIYANTAAIGLSAPSIAFDSIGRLYVYSWYFTVYATIPGTNDTYIAQEYNNVVVYDAPDPQSLSTLPPVVALLDGTGGLTNLTGGLSGTVVVAIGIDPRDGSILVNDDGLGGIVRLEAFPQSSPSGVLGDPQFTGLRGQRYQVHGMDGAVYNLISDAGLQVNSRFVFLDRGSCPPIATPCWSHPGSYLGSIGIQYRDDDGLMLHRLRITAGPAATGFSAIELDGQPLAVSGGADSGSWSVRWLSSHELLVKTAQFVLRLDNSDGFINQRVETAVPLSALTAHGLLGQTHRTRRYASPLKVIEGDVDDYVIVENDLFGSQFVFNQFQLA